MDATITQFLTSQTLGGYLAALAVLVAGIVLGAILGSWWGKAPPRRSR